MALGKKKMLHQAAAADDNNFAPVTYTGNNTARTIPVGFQPDLVWFKNRNNSTNSTHRHLVYDSVRGQSAGYIHTDGTSDEEAYPAFTGFSSNGIDLGGGVVGGADSGLNDGSTPGTYVAWCWKAGGTAVSNTDGTITSQVSANQDAGFSIATWSGDNTASNIGHGLGGSPELMIIKNRAGTNSWIVGVPDVLGTGYLTLNSSNQVSPSNVFGQVPDSTKYYFNTAAGGNGHLSTGNYVGYFFRSITGYQKVGSYSGSNSPITVTTGFQPRFLLIKRTDTSGNSWVIIDSARGVGSGAKALFPDLTSAESSGWNTDFISTPVLGFTISSNESYVSASGGTYIYLAIA